MESFSDYIVENYEIIIAGLALACTLWQAHVTRLHNRLSLTPHLNSWVHTTDAPVSITVKLTNNGVGPAVIKKFDVSLVSGDKEKGPYEQRLNKMINQLFSEYSGCFAINHSYLCPGQMLPSGQSVDVLQLDFNSKNPPSVHFIDEQVGKLRLYIKYSSVYKQKFVYDSEVYKKILRKIAG